MRGGIDRPSRVSAEREDDDITTTPEDEKTQVLPVADQAPPSEGPPTEIPKLADGIELIGEYEGSGFKDPPYIVRRADGQVIQLAPLLYLIAEAADGSRTNEEIAAAVSEAIKRGVSADNVRQLIDKRLRPLGVITAADGAQPELEKADPMLALKLKAALVPERLVNAVTTIFKPLFLPPIVLAVIAGLVALDIWLFAYHGIAQSMREVLYSPALLMMMLGLVILSAAFHEIGHASACAYGGARPGVMGAGLYLVWPAFYTDVTDAYRLGKGGRLRTDLGGIYFNVIFILATGAAYFMTGYEPLLLIIPFQHFEILHQLLPFIRLDGYYIVSDLTGVPDMFARIRPTLASLLPWKKASDKVKELKVWARALVTVYVLTVVPLLVFLFGLMVINAPRIFSTAYDSFILQWHKVQEGGGFTAAIGVFQMLILLLPAAGIVATFWTIFRRTTTAVWRRTEENPAGRAAFGLAATAAAAFLAYIWWPNGDYRPIQPGERGTVQGAVQQFGKVSTGRPALTEEREKDLGGAPLISSDEQQTPRQESRTPTTSTPTTTSETPTTTEQVTTTTETTTTETTTTTATTTATTTTTATP